MKGILGDLGKMKIPLKVDAKSVPQRPYLLIPSYKERVKAELDQMLDVEIIDPVKELECISPMVVQDKNIGELRICVNLRKLNDACMNDPFSMPLTDEGFEGVGDQEIYSFIDGFFGYHQIIIAKEDRHKTTFVTEWSYFQYTVMPFGLRMHLLYSLWLLLLHSNILFKSFFKFIGMNG